MLSAVPATQEQSVGAQTTAAASNPVEATGPHALARHVEHIPVTVYASSAQASRAVARRSPT